MVDVMPAVWLPKSHGHMIVHVCHSLYPHIFHGILGLPVYSLCSNILPRYGGFHKWGNQWLDDLKWKMPLEF